MSKPKIIEGHLIATGKKFAIVVSRFNSFLSERLSEGAIDTLVRHGVDSENLSVFKVPGCFEIPMVASRLAKSTKFNAVVCLGVLIRGATPHFDYIAAEATKGIAMVGMESNIPVTYGIITADTLEQAIERAGTKAGNKGHDAALAAIEMVDLFSKINS
jgi:6,7-dimethyl-8-ribityllumazine synthase